MSEQQALNIAPEAAQALAFPLTVRVDMLPETVALIGEAKALAANAETIHIETAEQYEVAAGELAKIKANFKSIDEQRKSLTKPLDDAKKKVMDYVRPFTDSLTAAEDLIKRGMIAFDERQEAARREAEAKAQEELRKQQEKLEQRAERMEGKGKTEQAELLREQAATAVVAVAAPAAPQVSGISKRKNYSASVTDLATLAKAAVAQALLADAGGDAAKLMQNLQALAAHAVPLKAIQADEKFLNQMAKAMQDDFAYPGCKLNTDTVMSARAAK